jgi:hypothetical protein
MAANLSDYSMSSALPLVSGATWRLLSVAVILVVVLKIQKRAQLGRIAGLVLIGHPAVVAALALGKPDGEYTSTAAAFVGWNGALLAILGLLGWWAYSFGFSRAARAWFLPSAPKPAPGPPRS